MKESKHKLDLKKLFRYAVVGCMIIFFGTIFSATLATALFACGMERENGLLISLVITIPLAILTFVILTSAQQHNHHRSNN